MKTTHLYAALRQRGYPLSWWPWRSLAYLATSVPIAGALGLGVAVFAAPVLAVVNAAKRGDPVADMRVVLVFGVLALIVLAFAPIGTIAVTAIERSRLAIVDGRPLPARPFRGLADRYRSGAAWLEVAYAFFLGGVVPVAYGILALILTVNFTLLASPWLAGDGGRIVLIWVVADEPGDTVPLVIAGVLLLPVVWYLLGLVAAGQAAVARRLIGGPDQQGALQEVTRSRARLVDAYEAERSRIERDVHDGAQPRLTSLTLHIGMARLDVPDDSPAARPLDVAHEQAKSLMVTLRQIVRGIRPPALATLGLGGAVRELAGESAVPVTVHDRVDRPLSEPVETTAYYVVAESLANVARHAGARRAEVRLGTAGRDLVVEVEDDGVGGADPGRGSGLTGLADRAAAAGGRLFVASPAGGPTLVRVELPAR